MSAALFNGVPLMATRPSDALDALIASDAIEAVRSDNLGRSIYDAIADKGWLNKSELAQQTGESRKVIARWQRDLIKKVKE